jgi:hypothetical protein
MKHLFAHTEATGEGYPAYINVGAVEDGFEVTVRPPATLVEVEGGAHHVVCGETFSFTLTTEQGQNLVKAISHHLVTR